MHACPTTPWLAKLETEVERLPKEKDERVAKLEAEVERLTKEKDERVTKLEAEVERLKLAKEKAEVNASFTSGYLPRVRKCEPQPTQSHMRCMCVLI